MESWLDAAMLAMRQDAICWGTEDCGGERQKTSTRLLAGSRWRHRKHLAAGLDPFDQEVFFHAHLAAHPYDGENALPTHFVGPLKRDAQALGHVIHVKKPNLNPLGRSCFIEE